MGLFNKKEKQQAYENGIRAQAEQMFPEVKDWDMTLVCLEKGSMELVKDVTKNAAKHVALNAAAHLVGLRVRSRSNAFEKNRYLICFKDTNCYFIPAGKETNSDVSLSSDDVLQLSKNEITSIAKQKGKKVSIQIGEETEMVFQYGVGANTIYNMGEGDAKLEAFIEAF